MLDPQLKIKIGNTLEPIIIKKYKILFLKIEDKFKKGKQNQIKILKIKLIKGLNEKITKFILFEVNIIWDNNPKAYLKGCKNPINPT